MNVLLYITVLLLGLFWILRSKLRKGRPVPGPKGWPFVGIGLSLTKDTIHEKFSEYARQYGDIFQVKVFGSNVIVLNSAEYIRKAFNTDPYKQYMNDRPKVFLGDKFLFGSQSIAFTERAFGSIHGDMRKGFTRAMKVYGEGKEEFEDKLRSELNTLVAKIESCNGKEFDIQELIKISLINIISLVMGGKNLRNDEETMKVLWDFNDASDFLMNQHVDVLMRACPLVRFVPSIYRDEYNKAAQTKVDITRKYFTEKMENHKPGVINGMVDFLIEEQRQARENGGEVMFTDERIIAMMLETIIRGILTTQSTLSSLFLVLLNHSDYQKKIQAELDFVVGRDRLPSISDRQNCPITEAVLMESQRYVTMAPFLGSHLCNADIQFEGFDIAANTMIMPNAWYVHHDERVWGDPWTFRPERWLDEHGKLLANDHPLRKSWMPFSTGLGESFARSRVFLYTARLLQRWTLEAPPGRHVSCDPRDGQYQFAITCRPKPFYCRVVERK